MKSFPHAIPRIALLLQGVRHYERELLGGIADYSNLHGPWEFFRSISYLTRDHIAPQELLRSWKPDALIIRESSPHIYDELLTTRLPTIYMPTTECHKGVTNIVVDDDNVGRLAAQHLYESGIRQFAFCGIHTFFWSRLRQQGFCKCVDEYQCPVQVFNSQTGDEFLSGNKKFSTFKKWLRHLPPHTGIFACTDDFALLVQEACIAIHRSIPDDLSLIGVGNDESVCKLTRIPITSVELNIRKAGYQAAGLLAQRLQQQRTQKNLPDSVIIEPLRIVPRRSTDFTQTRDPVVAKAISFIREGINHSLEVRDVVQQVNISRRGLYSRFHEATGKTISAYIRDCRMDRMSRLLLETNLTVSEIAYSMGYESDTNISRLFKKHFQMTPLAYRRKFAPH